MKNISLSIKKGEFVVVLGDTGSGNCFLNLILGKSSLFYGILG